MHGEDEDALNATETAALPGNARQWLIDALPPPLTDNLQHANNNRAATHFARGVVQLATEVERLRGEVARLRKLLREDHSGICAALAAAVPCDCGWSDPNPVNAGEALEVRLAEAQRERDTLRTLVDQAADWIHLSGATDVANTLRERAELPMVEDNKEPSDD
jgi:hypothetical protein